MTSVTIPNTVTSINQMAFAGCTSLEQVSVRATTPPLLYDNSFSDYTVPLSVPSGTAEAYRSAQGWRNFTTIVEDGTELTGIEAVKGNKATDVYYNLQGQRLQKPRRGLNIRNGRKLLITK